MEYSNVQYKSITGTVFGVVIANLAVLMRLTARYVGGIRHTIDDYLMLVALVSSSMPAVDLTDILSYSTGPLP